MSEYYIRITRSPNNISYLNSGRPYRIQSRVEATAEQVLEPATRDGAGDEETGVLPTHADGTVAADQPQYSHRTSSHVLRGPSPTSAS